MLKKILLTLILLTGVCAYANDNYLNSVIVSKTEDNTSIILRADEITKVKKEVVNPDRIIVTLKGITQAPSVDTLYKNISDVNGLVIQNEGNNEVKIYVDAPEISKADVVFETPDSAPITVINNVGEEKIVWSIISIAILLLIMRSAKNINTKSAEPNIAELIKEREKALYKNFQKEVATIPSINYKLKGYRKHVLKGETIRSYESRMSKV